MFTGICRYLVLGTIVMATFGTYAASYDDEVGNFYLHGSTGMGNSVTYGGLGDIIKINNLVKNIKANATAFDAFKSTLIKEICMSSKGEVKWSTETVKVTCTEGSPIAADAVKAFRAAHCSGFCQLNGNGFKKCSYNTQNGDYDCICKKGNARTLSAGPDATVAPITPARPAANTPEKSKSGVVQRNAVTASNPVTAPSEIHGRIIDTQEEGLIGASVRIDGTSSGAAADMDGNFTLKVPVGATSLTVSYVGMKSRTFPIDKVPSVIMLHEDSAILNEVVIAACSKDALNTLHATKGLISQTLNKCIPTECMVNYELGGQEYLTDEDGEFELDDDGQKILVQSECIDTNGRDCSPMPENAKIAKLENGQCVIKKCNEPQYKLENGTCVTQVGKDCTAEIKHAVAATYQMDGDSLKCTVSKCDEPGWVPNDKNTKCEESAGPCTDAQLSAVPHAKSGSLRKGQCIITECERGWHISKDGKKCEQAELSEEDSKNKVSELKDNAQKMKDKEQSTANKMLGAAAIGATGIGGMNLMSGMAEQKADDSAEEDMKAYLATFVCDYGQGRNIKGGEMNIDLPGGNALATVVAEYRALAADLKIRKEALGKTPGIEAEVIYDIAETGLYDNVGMGRQSGAYASLSKALMDETSADAKAWAEQKADAASKVKTGAITAGIGAVGGLVGNLAINGGDKNKNKVDEIKNKYDGMQNTDGDTVDTNTDTGSVNSSAAPLGNSGATPEVSNNPVVPQEPVISDNPPVAPVSADEHKDGNNASVPVAGAPEYTPLTEAEMRQKMQKVVNICEGYNRNGVIGKFVIAPEVRPWSDYDTSPHQRAYCIFVKAVTTGGGENDPIISGSATQYQEKLKKFAMDGYVYAPDDARGLRCKTLFQNADLGGIPWHGQDLPTGQSGNYTACEFSYKL
ncbi:MAG: carboxypeptidase-like regulatory domain-containing protein [Alphaproteobacteria bacterium]|nr:carboxypeptidase-like regulatory domain-containing protein [Alphaproteobacteria bacterium]